MAIGVYNPNIVDKSEKLILGEGAVYANYGEVSQTLLGATNGGSKVDITRNILDVKNDGLYGKTKGLRRMNTFDVKMTINFLKINYDNIVLGLPTTVNDGTDQDGTYKEIIFDLEMVAADVLTNVAFIGQNWDGDAVHVKIFNALNIDKIDLDFKSKDHLTAALTYTGFYAAATPTAPPFEIRNYY